MLLRDFGTTALRVSAVGLGCNNFGVRLDRAATAEVVLDALVRAGKIRHIGCSNFSAAQIDAAQEVAQQKSLTPFVAVEDQYSLLAREIERDLLPAIARHRLALLPYFPLASGMLSGKYRL